MSELVTRIQFKLEGRKPFLVSTSEELLDYLESEGSKSIGRGTLLTMDGKQYEVEEIDTTVEKKADKVYGMTMAQQIGESVPWSVTVAYTVREVA